MRFKTIMDGFSVALIGSLLSTAVLAADVVEFRIKPGTGNKPWNTRETVVELKVGQTLKIINEDSTPHQLHTSGSPCPHQPAKTLTGQAYECLISKVVDPDVDVFYDHIAGSSARFYMRATH